MTRADILAVLEHHSGIVDDAAEREALATALHEAMLAGYDSQLIRAVFRDCSSDGRVAKASMHGRLLGEVLDAAWRLAGGA